jgi:hypothetical protein
MEGSEQVDAFMDMQFSMWTASGNGTQIGTTLTITGIEVINGLFTAKLDFGSADSYLFNGDPRWLEIALRPSGSGNYVTLTPRQEITAVPYAIQAKTGGSGATWLINGSNIYYTAGNVGIGTSSPQKRLHINEGGTGSWLALQKNGGTKWNFDYVSNASLGYASSLRVAPDNSPLQLYLPDESGGMRMYLWPSGSAVPNMPHTGIKPTVAVWGDVLIGDIICIERNPMTLFMREQTGLPSTSGTVFFCARAINNDVDGGAGIVLHPDDGSGVESGELQLLAYGQGSGSYANAVRISTRSGTNQMTDRMLIKDGHVQIYGTIGATGGWVSSRSLKQNIRNLSTTNAETLLTSLTPVVFAYRSDPQARDRIGFIAEDVPEVFAGVDRKGVDYNGVIGLLTQLVQEQAKTIHQQQKQMEQLETRLQTIERALQMKAIPLKQ